MSSTCRVDGKVQNHTHVVLNIVHLQRERTTIPGAHTIFKFILYFVVYNVTCPLAAFGDERAPLVKPRHL